MTSTIILHVCNTCRSTHLDEKFAKMCEQSHKRLFKTPSDFYREQANGRTTDEIKSKA